MQLPNISTDSEILLNVYGVYHLARLKADPKTRHLAKDFETMQDKLRLKMNARKDKGIEEQVELASEDYIQIELDRAIKKLERDILNEVNDNRKSPLFQKYFSKGLRYVTAAAIKSQIERVENILANLGQETVGKLKSSHYNGLKNKLSELKTAHQAVETIQTAYSNVFSEEKSARLEWRKECQQEHARLMLIFEGDKKMGDSFFKKIKGKKKEKVEEEIVENTAESEEKTKEEGK
jgi:hypothetical protein